MTPMTRFYIGAIIAAGATVLVAAAPREYPQPGLALVFLAAMLLVSLFKLRLPLGLGQSTMSMAYVVDFTVLVTMGVDVAMLIAAAGVLAQCTINVGRVQPWYRTAFSVAVIVLSVQAAGQVWQLLGGAEHPPNVLASLLPLCGAAVLYFGINTGLVAGAVSLSNGVSAFGFWRRNFVGTVPAFLLAVVVAATMVTFRDGYLVAVVALVPMAVGHLAYTAWFRQVAQQSAAVA